MKKKNNNEEANENQEKYKDREDAVIMTKDLSR